MSHELIINAIRQRATMNEHPGPVACRNFTGASIIEAVKAAQDLQPKDQRSGARLVGISRDTYALITKLLVLQQQHIPQQHKDTIAQALQLIDERKMIEARALTQDLIATLWLKRKDHKIKQRQKRLDQTLIHISESCESTRDLEIPRNLSPEEARQAVATLTTSTILIGQLIRRLLGEGEES